MSVRQPAIAGNENYTFDSGAERQNEKLPPSLPTGGRGREGVRGEEGSRRKISSISNGLPGGDGGGGGVRERKHKELFKEGGGAV